MKCITLVGAAITVMMAMLVAFSAPAMADHNRWDDGWHANHRWDDGCVGGVQGGECIGVGSARGWGNAWWHGGIWNDWWWSLGAAGLDDCFWWDGDLFCEVAF